MNFVFQERFTIPFGSDLFIFLMEKVCSSPVFFEEVTVNSDNLEVWVDVAGTVAIDPKDPEVGIFEDTIRLGEVEAAYVLMDNNALLEIPDILADGLGMQIEKNYSHYLDQAVGCYE